MQRQDQLLKQIPEVERVFGKAGRAETSTDPAPLSMMETVVVLAPREQWRTRERWYSDWPDFVKPLLRPLWPETISWDELVNEMNERLTLPGQTNAWTMPIKNRIDMLWTDFVNRDDPVQRSLIEQDRNKALAELEQLKEDMEKHQQAIAEIEREARRANVPRGWLRPQ